MPDAKTNPWNSKKRLASLEYTDGGSDASGSKGSKGDENPTEEYE